MPDVSLDNDAVRFVILVVAANSCVVRGLSRVKAKTKKVEEQQSPWTKAATMSLSSTVDGGLVHLGETRAVILMSWKFT